MASMMALRSFDLDQCPINPCVVLRKPALSSSTVVILKKILDGETVNEMIAKAAEIQIQRPSVI